MKMKSKNPRKLNKWRRVNRFRSFLLNFKSFSKKEIEWLTNNMSNEFVRFIVEIVGNLKNRKLKISKQAWKKLEPFNLLMEKLNCCKVRLDTKKTLINQKGGFIGALISAVLGSLVSTVLAKASDSLTEK